MSRSTTETALNQVFSDSLTVTATDVKNLTRLRQQAIFKPGIATTGDDAAAGTDYTDLPLWSNNTGGQITIQSITFTSGATGFTESASLTSTLTITKRLSTGGSSTTVATGTTNTVANGGFGTMTTGMLATFTLTAANTQLPAGSGLFLSKTHASTGTVVPGGIITISYTED